MPAGSLLVPILSATFYWHDYETWGADPQRDRPCQFAGQRTDADFNEVGDPMVLYCRPATDLLPQPDACLVTGITPQEAEAKGVGEADFAATIEAALSVPATCGVGYNSLRFDDEVTRHLLYRNLADPYAREWRNGNSRWDLIDTLRAARALRPDGIVWPQRDDGSASFRLGDLTEANGIPHVGAHDALVDVRATIALARRLRQVQPRLLDWALGLRDRQRVRALLDSGEPLIHVSARFPAALGCLAPVLPLAPHPTNTNGVICFDLREDPTLLLDLSVEEIGTRVFTPAADLPEGKARIPLKTVHVNRSPFLAPMGTLAPAAADLWSIDPAEVRRRAQAAKAASEALSAKVRAVHQAPGAQAGRESDPDLMLYSGGFIPESDRRTLDRLRRLSPQELSGSRPRFQDRRLPEMLLRYRARNWPETLDEPQREAWNHYRLARLTDPDGGGSITLDRYQQRLSELAESQVDRPDILPLIAALADWAERVMDAED